ncbi:MAG: hypothetical protein KC731_11585 [Myxococcales bacterium]|nr:hypothetical protein [Myxococcales bacterium]
MGEAQKVRRKKKPKSRILAAKAAPAGTSSSKTEQERKVAARWTSTLVEGGWTVVSDFFLTNYRRLSPPLTNTEAMLVVHLLRFKWDERPPRPAYKTLAKYMGLTDTAVRGHARSLETKGCLKRRKRVGAPNWFYLEPLFEKLEALMPEVAAEEEAQKAKQAEEEKWPGLE